MVTSPRLSSTWYLAVATLLVVASPSTLLAEQPDGDVDDQECATYLESDDRENAEALTLHGVACFEAGDYHWALTYYRRAHDIDPDPFLLGAIGRSLHELGLYEPAMDYYNKFLDQQPTPSGADRIRQRVDELEEARHDDGATVTLKSAPPETSAFVVLDNGEWYELGDTPLEITVRDNDYEFAFEADGYRPRHESTGVSSGDETSVETELVSEDSALDASARSRRRAGIWTMGGSLLAGAAGTTLLVISAQEQNSADNLNRDNFDDDVDFQRRYTDHLDTASTTRRWGTVSAAVGITGLLTGSILYLSTLSSDSTPDRDEVPGDETDETSAQTTISPALGPAGIQLRGRF